MYEALIIRYVMNYQLVSKATFIDFIDDKCHIKKLKSYGTCLTTYYEHFI